jgi:hypothetical protein
MGVCSFRAILSEEFRFFYFFMDCQLGCITAILRGHLGVSKELNTNVEDLFKHYLRIKDHEHPSTGE